MGKELNITEAIEVTTVTSEEITYLSELSLALISGGEMAVSL
jgi:hypothetical protein